MLVSFERKVSPIAAPVAYSHATRPLSTKRTSRSRVSVATVFLVYELGRQLYDERAQP